METIFAEKVNGLTKGSKSATIRNDEMGPFLKKHWSFRWADRIRQNRNWGWLWVVLYVTLFKLGLGLILISYVRISGDDPALTRLPWILLIWFLLYQPLFNRWVAKNK
tara:strand:+ start:607 stop:930 length:324 start_codon:yes stop_codon:yes gene_type:complete